ncbi:hypothetical protein V2J09_017018 [Rumex salicifolius]
MNNASLLGQVEGKIAGVEKKAWHWTIIFVSSILVVATTTPAIRYGTNMEEEGRICSSKAIEIESGIVKKDGSKQNGLTKDESLENGFASAHVTNKDSWQQVGLLLVTGYNCGWILSYSSLILVPLSWAWGISSLIIFGIFTAYPHWVLSSFHFIDGQRFIRYRDIMGFLFGKRMYYITWFLQFSTLLLGNMGFILLSGLALKEINLAFSDNTLRLQYFIIMTGAAYCIFSFVVPNISAMRLWSYASAFLTFLYIALLLAICIKDDSILVFFLLLESILNTGIKNKDQDYQVRGSKPDKIFNAFSAISAIIVTNTSGMLLELQSTLRNPAEKNMKRALFTQYTLGLMGYYGVCILGYWAYGTQVSQYLPKQLSGPKWVKILINVIVFLQNIISQHIFVQPVHEFLDTKFLKFGESIYSRDNSRRRFTLRVIVFAGNTLVTAAIPFMGDFINLIGSFTLLPLTFIFPSMIFLKVTSQSNGIKNKDQDYQVRGSKPDKIFNAFSAISAIIVTNTSGITRSLIYTCIHKSQLNYHSSLYAVYSKESSREEHEKSSVYTVYFRAKGYYDVCILGYWAYGTQVSQYLPKQLSGPKWVKILINVIVFLQNIISQHIFVQPVHEFLDTKFLKFGESIYSRDNSRRRFTLRVFVFAGNTLVTAAIPFMGDFINLIGSFTLLPLTFIFPSMIFLKVTSQSNGIKNKDQDYQVRGSKPDKIFNAFSAISAIIVTNTSGITRSLIYTCIHKSQLNYHSSLYAVYSKESSREEHEKSSVYTVYFRAKGYYDVCILGYWAYGTQVSQYLPKQLSGPKWVKILINVIVFLQNIISQHIFVQPVHEFLDTKFLKFGEIFVFAGNTLVTAAIPFMGDFINLIGSFTLLLLTFIFPSMIFLKVKWKTTGSGKKAMHCTIILASSIIAIPATTSATRLIAKDIKQYHFFANA